MHQVALVFKIVRCTWACDSCVWSKYGITIHPWHLHHSSSWSRHAKHMLMFPNVFTYELVFPQRQTQRASYLWLVAQEPCVTCDISCSSWSFQRVQGLHMFQDNISISRRVLNQRTHRASIRWTRNIHLHTLKFCWSWAALLDQTISTGSAITSYMPRTASPHGWLHKRNTASWFLDCSMTSQHLAQMAFVLWKPLHYCFWMSTALSRPALLIISLTPAHGVGTVEEAASGGGWDALHEEPASQCYGFRLTDRVWFEIFLTLLT